MKKFIVSMFLDERGVVSTKRIVGFMCALMLCITMFANQFTPEHIKPSDTLVNTVGLLAFGCLGLTSVDKFSFKKPIDSKEPENG